MPEERADRQSLGTTRRAIVRTLRSGGLAAVVQYAIVIAAFPLIIRRIGPVSFGAWTAIASLLAIGALADAGMRTEIIRRVGGALGRNDVAELRESVRTGVAIVGAAAAGITALGLLLTPEFRLFIFPGGVPGYSGGELDAVLRCTIVLLGCSLVVDAHLAALRGVQRADVESLSIIAGFTVGTAATVALAMYGFGLWALLVGRAVQAFIGWGSQGAALRRLLPQLGFGFGRPSFSVVRNYLSFSSLLVLSQIGDVVDAQWDRVVLARFVGPASVAFFAVGTLLLLQLKTLAVIPLAPIVTAVSELRGRSDAMLEQTYALLSRAGAALATTLIALAFVFSPAFIHLWLGPGFQQAGTAARLFAVAVALNLLCAAPSMRCIGQGWHRLVAASAATNIVVNGVASFALAARIGFIGPLIGSITGNAAGVGVFYGLLWRRTREHWTLPALRSPLVGVTAGAVVILGGLDQPDGWLPLIASAAVFAIFVGVATVFAERLPIISLFRPKPPR